jgi:deoxyguanosine kinase
MNTNNKPMIISIEGNIGSGKSTLVSILQNTFKDNSDYHFVQEPVDIWNTITDENGVTILEKFYEDSQKYAFQFQMMAYISRLSIIKNAYNNVKCKYIITERCVYTDANVFAKMLFDEGKISKIEYTIYKKWFDEFIDEIPISKMIYVKTNAETALNRVIKRNRKGEHIPLEYLQNCNKYHEDWLNSETIDLLTLNGEIDIYENKDTLNEWIQHIMVFITGNRLIQSTNQNQEQKMIHDGLIILDPMDMIVFAIMSPFILWCLQIVY